MPLDRKITISVSAPGYRDNNGRYVEGATTTFNVWATRHDKTLTDVAEAGGSRTEILRTYRIRWLRELNWTNTNQIKVGDGSFSVVAITDPYTPIVWSVDKLIEVTDRDGSGRRRFMDLELRYTI